MPDIDPDFDAPFTVRADGTVTGADDYAPSVWHDDSDDITIDGSGWEPFSTGYTGQYGYRGAVMHASETFGGRLRGDVLRTPGTYVLCTVECLPDDDDDDDPEPAGWVVLRKSDTDAGNA